MKERVEGKGLTCGLCVHVPSWALLTERNMIQVQNGAQENVYKSQPAFYPALERPLPALLAVGDGAVAP